MRSVTGAPVTGDDLYGRGREIDAIWGKLEQGEHVLLLAPRRVGKTSLMMELRRAPRPGWDVIFVNLESSASPEDCFAKLVAAISEHPGYRTWVERIPFRNAIRGVLRGLGRARVRTETVEIDIRTAMLGDWSNAADRLHERLAKPPEPETKLLLVLDELPILIARILKKSDGRDEADLLLSKLRELRLSEDLRNRVHFLVGGSIGLDAVLRRVGLSATANDLSPLYLGPWDEQVARDFLAELGRTERFELPSPEIDLILEMLAELVPFHVQLFFLAIREACKGDVALVSRGLIELCFRERLAGPQGTPYLDHFAERLELIFTEPEVELANTVLAIACQSTDGVPKSEVEDLEPANAKLLSPVLRDLDSHGYLVQDGEALRFRSNLLRKWWKRFQAPGVQP